MLDKVLFGLQKTEIKISRLVRSPLNSCPRIGCQCGPVEIAVAGEVGAISVRIPQISATGVYPPLGKDT